MPLPNVKPSEEKPMNVLEMLKKSQEAQKNAPVSEQIKKLVPTAPVGGATAPTPKAVDIKDKVVFEKELVIKAPVAKVHKIKVLKLGDPAQVYPFLTECSCGFQSRTSTEDNAKQAVEAHFTIGATPKPR